jgi:hypothetical protein
MITLSLFSEGKVLTYTDSLAISFLGIPLQIPIEKQKVQSVVTAIRNRQSKNPDSIMLKIAPLQAEIEKFKKSLKLPDWLVYQLIRRVAEKINSKYEDYTKYTLTKFVLLKATGYEPLIYTSNDKILLYIKSTDTIFNLPNKIINDKQYVCLNYHDYGHQINFEAENFYQQYIEFVQNGKDFKYTINYLPSFQKETYVERKISFRYRQKNEFYTILVNPEIQDYFSNYPVTEYRYQFSIPFSEIAFNTLIPDLRKRIKDLSVEKGVEYLMIFVRDGFEFETDTKLFGREKRLSAEETLTYNSSDCEDRSALFFLLVKEIYNLPMAIISYPEHVNVAVKLPKQKGRTINIDNAHFTICEPTPQKTKRGIGWMPKQIRKQSFEVAYVYKQ